ncbi:MAG: CRISPR-associated endonuclease Cas3'', partial [Desulfurococcaceae archaeon]
MRTSDEPCLLLAEAIEERWPLAYAAVRDGRLVVSGLLDHSRDVASILTGVEILRRRLLVLGERARDFYGWRDEDVLGLARAAALLHDLGKASQRYRQRALEGLKRCRGPQHSISFPHHELVPAALLLAYASNVDERLRRAIDIVAEAVARHHAAMIGRGQQSRGHRIPTNELVEIARGIPRGFVEELKDECEGHGLCLDILEATGKALEEGGDLVSVADGLANG